MSARTTQSPSVRAGRQIVSEMRDLARSTVDVQFKANPQLAQVMFGERYDACVRDTRSHYEALAQALLADEPAIFDHYVQWTKVLLAHVGLPDSCLTGSLESMDVALCERLPDAESDVSRRYIARSVAYISTTAWEAPSAFDGADELSSVASRYLDAILNGDRREAARLVREQAEAGVPIHRIYDGLFRRAQHEVGNLWHAGRISVAMEHYITQATEVIMVQFSGLFRREPVAGKTFLGACVAGEQHDLGMRMACDALEHEGWNAVYLGANVPDAALAHAIQEHRPDVLGLSATTTFRVDAVRRAIDNVRGAGHSELPIVVGGRQFEQVDGLWNRVGADAMCRDIASLRAYAMRFAPPQLA